MWRHHLKLNLVVFIWSLTAILGQWITLPRLELVFLRTAFAGLLLYAFWQWYRLRRGTPMVWPRRPIRLLANGAIVGLHWVLFFSSAKLNASVCLAGIATITLWTALLEPLIARTSWKPFEIMLGAVIALALFQISRAEADHLPALLLSLGASVAAAIFSILNGLWTRDEDAIGVTILEMAGAAILCLTAALTRSLFQGTWPQFWPAPMDWLWMTILIVFCTAYAYVIYIQLLRKLSVFSINLASNFEPIYGMILAAILLGESKYLSSDFYMNSLVILLCVIVHTWMQAKTAS
ncbi:MAG: drug/metabolite transporter (DMT)-like permease [Verrucomicrobiales bacterium]|jgi:drug/metabolite transporter (DMT)-like permease